MSDELERVNEELGAVDRSLFVDDRELRRRINPKLGWDRFRAAVRDAEKQRSPNGLVFPKINALWGGRYWPAVKLWLDDDAGVTEHELTNIGDDRPESFHASPRKKARPQVHSADRPPLLVREARPDQHDGLSGSVHRLAARRQ
jgi:hypothetical protein